jgi:hypothetical protein
MNIIGSRSPSGLSLADFREVASKGEAVLVTVQGQSYTVLAQGVLQGKFGDRSVLHVQSDVDTTGLFMQAMSDSFGTSLSKTIVDELGLTPSPGKPIGSRNVMLALDMAETSMATLEAVDFMTMLDCSATGGGPNFRSALQQLGLASASVSQTEKVAIDQHMRLRFAQAVAGGESPVAHATAMSWLKTELSHFSKGQT